MKPLESSLSKLQYVAEKLKQGTGYPAYLNTVDKLDRFPQVLRVAAGGVVGLLSFMTPSSIRYWSVRMDKKQDRMKYFFISGGIISSDVLTFFAGTFTPVLSLVALLQEAQTTLSQMPKEHVLVLFGGIALTSKIAANAIVHAGADFVEKTSHNDK